MTSLVCMTPVGGTIPENARIEKHECLTNLLHRTNSVRSFGDEIITGWVQADFGVYWVKVYDEPMVNIHGHALYKGLACKVKQLSNLTWALTPIDTVYIPVTQEPGLYFDTAKTLNRSGVYQKHREAIKNETNQ